MPGTTFQVEITATLTLTVSSAPHQKEKPEASEPDRARVTSMLSPSAQHTPRTPERPQPLRDQTLIRALYAHGLLRPGDTLVWHRPRTGVRHKAVLTSDCRLRLEGYTEEFSPSGAARILTGGSHDGTRAWCTVDGGVSLKELRGLLPRPVA